MNLIPRKFRTPRNRYIVIAALVMGVLVLFIPQKKKPVEKPVRHNEEIDALWDSIDPKIAEYDSVIQELDKKLKEFSIH